MIVVFKCSSAEAKSEGVRSGKGGESAPEQKKREGIRGNIAEAEYPKEKIAMQPQVILQPGGVVQTAAAPQPAPVVQQVPVPAPA